MGILRPFATANGLAKSAVDEKAVPPRPTEFDADCLLAAAKASVKEFADYVNETEESYPSLVDDIVKAATNTFDKDGYNMCRALEDYAYWCGSMELAEICDNYFSNLYYASREAIKEWVAKYGVELAVPIGTEVTLKSWSHNKQFKGTITRNEPVYGECVVTVPDLKHKHGYGYVMGYENPEIFV